MKASCKYSLAYFLTMLLFCHLGADRMSAQHIREERPHSVFLETGGIDASLPPDSTRMINWSVFLELGIIGANFVPYEYSFWDVFSDYPLFGAGIGYDYRWSDFQDHPYLALRCSFGGPKFYVHLRSIFSKEFGHVLLGIGAAAFWLHNGFSWVEERYRGKTHFADLQPAINIGIRTDRVQILFEGSIHAGLLDDPLLFILGINTAMRL